ncbi:MAG: lipopolysaccharide biosynthesis protein [Emcibacteraceae bacterium]|nr:lipopolysaccharide biosynthesis protein [Emcibacteraceae bacterium]
MSLENKIKTALKWSVLSKVAIQLFSWVLTFWTIRILTPDDYGLFALAMLIISFFYLINEFGLGPAIVVEEDLTEEKIRSAAGLIITINLVISLIVFFSAPLIAVLLEDQRVELVIQIISIQFIIGGFSVVPRALLVRRLDFKRKELIFFFRNLTAGVSTLVLAILGYGIWALVWGNLAALVISAVLLNLSEFHIPSFDFKKVKPMIKFGTNILVQRTVWWLYLEADIFIINRVLSTTLVGSYYTAKSLAAMPGDKIGQLVNEIIFAGFSKIRDNKPLVTQSLTRGIKMISIIMFPVYFGISSVSSELVHVLLGEKWLESILPLQILCIVFAFRIISVPFSEVLNALNHSKIAAQNTIIISVIVIASLVTGSNWGILGVCIAWGIGYMIAFNIVTHRGARYTGIGIRALIKILSRPLLCSCLMYAVYILYVYNYQLTCFSFINCLF